MLRKTVLSLAVAAFFGGAVKTQVAFASDDIWDLMNPAWWADKMDDDDDDWDYRHYGRGPYYGFPYAGYPPYYAYPIPMEQKKKKQPPPPRLPE